MNNPDMYTLEKANKFHLDEMHREAKIHLMLRNAKEERDSKDITVNRRRTFSLAVTALIAAILTFLRRI
jgi:hypothetical protein